ncbi:MAG: reverse transcriptase-like protein [Propionicimonas sp.]
MARPRRVPQDGPSIFDLDAPDEGPVGPDEHVQPGRSLVIEADGGSRGNPGPAAYGALVRDAATDEVLNSEGLTLGVATNNVAEYSALIAGLEMARAIDPDAALDVRMDSRLVIEQMAGRWKVKHPAMKPLFATARKLVPALVTWTWVPREENTSADALVNAALDGSPRRRR